MFRKKKFVGSVTVFEESNVEAIDRFNDLGLDENADFERIDHLSVTQLGQLAIGNAQAGKEATARALQIATETREIGHQTAQSLHHQTRQLEGAGEDFQVVHDYLDKSERIMEKMKKPKILRLLQGKRHKAKGLQEANMTRREQEVYNELRRNGVETLRYGVMKETPEISLDDMEREELLSPVTPQSNRRNPKSSLKQKHMNHHSHIISTKAINEDYSEYSPDVAQILRGQDDDLDHISDALVDMENIAVAMNHELDYQAHLIDQVQDYTVQTAKRTKDNAAKIALLD